MIDLDSSLWGRSWESVHFGVFLNSSKSCSSLHVSGLLQLGFMKKKKDKAFWACSVEERKKSMRTQMGISGLDVNFCPCQTGHGGENLHVLGLQM